MSHNFRTWSLELSFKSKNKRSKVWSEVSVKFGE